MRVLTARIFFEGEMPRIGSGRRTVTAKLGHKWARLEFCGRYGGRIKVQEFWNLKPTIVEDSDAAHA